MHDKALLAATVTFPSYPEAYETVSKVSCYQPILDSIVVSIPACHAGDRGSIPRRGGTHFFSSVAALSR